MRHVIDVIVHANEPIGKLKPLWTSTGFSPEVARTHVKNVSGILDRVDTRLNLKLIGSLPAGAIEQIRVHWLLDLMNGPFEIGKLDSFIQLLWSCNSKPGFEIMGNPGHFFQSNFTEREELDLWTKSIKFMIKNFVQKYGIDYVRQWNFESWNEPDHHIHNPFGRHSNATYLNYLEATWNALLEFDGLKFGGPGGSCRPPNFIKLCKTFLEFCKEKLLDGNNENNIIKFVSFHRKGQGEIDSILTDEVRKTVPFIEETLTAEMVAKNNVSIFNDEGDPQKACGFNTKRGPHKHCYDFK